MNEPRNDEIIHIFASVLHQNVELTQRLVAHANTSDEILKKMEKILTRNNKCIKILFLVSVAGGYYQHKKNQSLEKRLDLLEGKDRGE